MSQEIYIKKIPKSCGCCEFYSHNRYNDAYCLCLYMRLSYVDKEKDCPLKSLHDHDKELVAKVLERVKKELDGDYNQYRINYIIDPIQKEFEK